MQIASHTKRFPPFHGTIVIPSGHFPSSGLGLWVQVWMECEQWAQSLKHTYLHISESGGSWGGGGGGGGGGEIKREKIVLKPQPGQKPGLVLQGKHKAKRGKEQ